jgi:hypothetical protein
MEMTPLGINGRRLAPMNGVYTTGASGALLAPSQAAGFAIMPAGHTERPAQIQIYGQQFFEIPDIPFRGVAGETGRRSVSRVIRMASIYHEIEVH